MRILWDFRLFSLGYATRGVGTYTRAAAAAVIAQNTDAQIVIWGDRSAAPAECAGWPVEWVPYSAADWKRDLFTIPSLIARNKIDLFHYWIGLGPLWRIGAGMFHPCKTCMTVYDLGVEYWDYVPYLSSMKKTWYWRMQKAIARGIDGFICISGATAGDLQRTIKRAPGRSEVVYVPIGEPCAGDADRLPYFVTLGGAVNKNLQSVIDAFTAARREFPEYRLVVCGDVDNSEELAGPVPGVVSFERMEHYERHLAEASGLIFCSRHEGLGLPPLEAMRHACPVVLSDIPCLRETCDGAAIFVDPGDPSSIAAGIRECISNRKEWERRAAEGCVRYRGMSGNAGRKVLEMYGEILSRSRR